MAEPHAELSDVEMTDDSELSDLSSTDGAELVGLGDDVSLAESSLSELAASDEEGESSLSQLSLADGDEHDDLSSLSSDGDSSAIDLPVNQSTPATGEEKLSAESAVGENRRIPSPPIDAVAEQVVAERQGFEPQKQLEQVPPRIKSADGQAEVIGPTASTSSPASELANLNLALEDAIEAENFDLCDELAMKIQDMEAAMASQEKDKPMPIEPAGSGTVGTSAESTSQDDAITERESNEIVDDQPICKSFHYIKEDGTASDVLQAEEALALAARGVITDSTLCFSSEPEFSFEAWTPWRVCKTKFIPASTTKSTISTDKPVAADARSSDAVHEQLKNLENALEEAMEAEEFDRCDELMMQIHELESQSTTAPTDAAKQPLQIEGGADHHDHGHDAAVSADIPEFEFYVMNLRKALEASTEGTEEHADISKTLHELEDTLTHLKADRDDDDGGELFEAAETAAAVRIQSRERGRQARRQVAMEGEAAIQIQSRHRGRSARRHVETLGEAGPEANGTGEDSIGGQAEAATLIQSRQRSRMARREVDDRRREAESHAAAAAQIQSRERGRQARRQRGIEGEAAVRIQSRHRGRTARRHVQTLGGAGHTVDVDEFFDRASKFGTVDGRVSFAELVAVFEVEFIASPELRAWVTAAAPASPRDDLKAAAIADERLCWSKEWYRCMRGVALSIGAPLGPLLPEKEEDLPPDVAAGLQDRFSAQVKQRFEGEQRGFWFAALAAFSELDDGEEAGLDRTAFHDLCDQMFGTLGPLESPRAAASAVDGGDDGGELFEAAETAAAVRIQSRERGRQARRQVAMEGEAAIQIQSRHRGNSSRDRRRLDRSVSGELSVDFEEHLVFLDAAEHKRAEEDREILERNNSYVRHGSATKIQRAYRDRRHSGTDQADELAMSPDSERLRQYKQEGAAVGIQTRYRGIATRRHVSELKRIRADNMTEVKRLQNEHRAATVIQGRHRGRLARNQAANRAEVERGQKQRHAAVKIQSRHRGRVTRRKVSSRQTNKEHKAQDSRVESAALKIQSRQRGHATRRAVRERRSLRQDSSGQHQKDCAATKIQSVYRERKLRSRADDLQAIYSNHQMLDYIGCRHMSTSPATLQADLKDLMEDTVAWSEDDFMTNGTGAIEKVASESANIENSKPVSKHKLPGVEEALKYLRSAGVDVSENELADMVLQRLAKRVVSQQGEIEQLKARSGGAASRKRRVRSRPRRRRKSAQDIADSTDGLDKTPLQPAGGAMMARTPHPPSPGRRGGLKVDRGSGIHSARQHRAPTDSTVSSRLKMSYTREERLRLRLLELERARIELQRALYEQASRGDSLERQLRQAQRSSESGMRENLEAAKLQQMVAASVNHAERLSSELALINAEYATSVSEVDLLAARKSPRHGGIPTTPVHGSQQAWASGPLNSPRSINSGVLEARKAYSVRHGNMRMQPPLNSTRTARRPLLKTHIGGARPLPPSRHRDKIADKKSRVAAEREAMRRDMEAEYFGAKKAREAYRASVILP